MRPLNNRQEDTISLELQELLQRHPIPMPSLKDRRKSLYFSYFLHPKKKFETCLGPAGTVQRSLHLLTHKNWSSWVTGLKMINLKGTFMSLWFVGTGGSYILPFRMDLKSTARNFSDAPIFHSGHSAKKKKEICCGAREHMPSSRQPYHRCPCPRCTIILLETLTEVV